VILKTPNFSNKTASIVWMLILALALVLVDYFLSPVMTENGWKLQKVLQVDNKLLNSLHCEEEIKQYSSITQEKIFLAKACLTNKALIVVKESKYKGELLVFNKDKRERIATNIQSPKIIAVSSGNEIYIQELGRDRILKFFKKKNH
jgi:hypothetical protein